MTYKEAKEILETLEVQVPIGCGRDFQVARELAIKAFEKQIPKKVDEYYEHGISKFKTGYCHSCGAAVTEDMNYCWDCSQAIDWSE